MVGEVLDGDPPSLTPEGLEAFGDPGVEAATTDRVQLLVKDLADLVVGERDGFAGSGFEKLCGDRFIVAAASSTICVPRNRPSTL